MSNFSINFASIFITWLIFSLNIKICTSTMTPNFSQIHSTQKFKKKMFSTRIALNLPNSSHPLLIQQLSVHGRFKLAQLKEKKKNSGGNFAVSFILASGIYGTRNEIQYTRQKVGASFQLQSSLYFPNQIINFFFKLIPSPKKSSTCSTRMKSLSADNIPRSS